MSDVRQAVMKHLLQLCANDQLRADLTEDTDLLGSGALDSFGAVQLLHFVEQEFGIRIPDGDIGPEIFSTAATLGDYVEKRRAAA
jgi:D-alanine--poly(phosphoribitol) ligase subunit 2